MTDQCIKWADRDDLESVAIQIIYQMKDCTGVFRDYENHFYIGKVPPEHYGKIQSLFFSDWFNRANEQAIKSKELFYSGMNIIPLSQLPDEILNIVLERRRFTECKDSPEYILQRIIKTLEEGDGIKADLTALQPLTVDAAEQSDAANQERTDAADQSDAANDQAQAAGEQMERELASIYGRGATGRRRMIMKDRFHLTISQIWEFENPGSVWRDLTPGEKHAYTNAIGQAIERARSKK